MLACRLLRFRTWFGQNGLNLHLRIKSDRLHFMVQVRINLFRHPVVVWALLQWSGEVRVQIFPCCHIVVSKQIFYMTDKQCCSLQWPNHVIQQSFQIKLPNSIENGPIYFYINSSSFDFGSSLQNQIDLIIRLFV